MKQLLIIFLCVINLSGFTQSLDSLDCGHIEREYDEFEKETTLRTPLLKNCSLTKVISKSGTRYYLSVYAPGATVNVGEGGVKIILSNDQILSFPSEKISVDVTSVGGYSYSAFIPINQATLQLLQKYQVLKWKLYIYDNSQNSKDATEFMEAVSCIVKMK